MPSFRLLTGLPPYGPYPLAFPADWGRLGREGTVVEIVDATGDAWVGNFARGIAGPTTAFAHPDRKHVVVLSRGCLWRVDPNARDAACLQSSIDAIWAIPGADDVLLSVQSLGFARLGQSGVEWYTRRLSFHGFEAVQVSAQEAVGLAWDAFEEHWAPFAVDLSSGRSRGGAQSRDPDEWLPPLEVSEVTQLVAAADEAVVRLATGSLRSPVALLWSPAAERGRSAHGMRQFFVFGLFTLAHFTLSIASLFVGGGFIMNALDGEGSGAAASIAGVLLDVLFFPLGALTARTSGSAGEYAMLTLNSMIWGLAATVAWRWWRRRRRTVRGA